MRDIRRQVGMVFQNPDNQIVASIVEEDVAFGPENLGIPPAEIRQRVQEALRAVGMWEYRRRAHHMLSGGQKQRVAICLLSTSSWALPRNGIWTPAIWYPTTWSSVSR